MQNSPPSSLPFQYKALCIIDVQPKTLAPETNHVVTAIIDHINETEYGTYLVSEYFVDERSMLSQQTNLPVDSLGQTDSGILQALSGKQRPVLKVEKNTRSCFEGENKKILQKLKNDAIEELHFVGFDINDCVMASLFQANDNGFFTYVIEELCHQNQMLEDFKTASLKILRRQKLTLALKEVTNQED